jgi:2-polyprenyl-3-methyl-5-hydroxy-6-metoxy-1,4-benzoquinol methylase
MKQADQVSTSPEASEAPKKHHVCPWWLGYLLLSPLRRLAENPDTMLSPYLEPGMTAIDVGCAMGYFSIPMARMVGAGGRVVCVDIQERMLTSLSKRARRKGVDSIIETRLSSDASLGLDDLQGKADLALAMHVVHETSFPERFVNECAGTLKEGGHLLIMEPKGHVSAAEFEQIRELVQGLGLVECAPPQLRRSHTTVVRRPHACA